MTDIFTTEQKIAIAQVVEDMARVYVDSLVAPPTGTPPVQPPDPPVPPVVVPPPMVLKPSGPITVTGDGKVIEGMDITGGVRSVNFSGLTIRNCRIRHPGGEGIFAQACTGLTIENVEIENTSAAIGQNPNPAEHINIKLNNVSGACKITRAILRGACGIYGVISPADFHLNFLEGYNMRSPAKPLPLRGQLVQMNQCPNNVLLEDFSCINDPKNSRPEDIISIYQCGANKVRIRRGLLDGNNCPSGVMIMIENGTIGALIEDVDCVRHGNGAFFFYDQSHNGIFRNCRMRDQIPGNQGLGVPSSASSGSPVNLVAQPSQNGLPAVTGARFEGIKYWNISPNHMWVAPGTFVDMVSQDFTPRAPIRNQFAW